MNLNFASYNSALNSQWKNGGRGMSKVTISHSLGVHRKWEEPSNKLVFSRTQ